MTLREKPKYAHALSLYCSTRHSRNSFGPLPQGYCERKKTLNLIKTTSSVLSVLFSIYVYNHKLFCCYYRCTGEMIPNHGSVSWRRKVSTIVINALLHYFFIRVSYPHYCYRTLSSLPNPGRSKYVFTHTHSYKHYPLYRTMV